MIAVVIEAEETEKTCLCLSAKEARELTTSKNSEVCRKIMARANEEIRACANRGVNRASVTLYQSEGKQACEFARNWLEELGYTVSLSSSFLAVKW